MVFQSWLVSVEQGTLDGIEMYFVHCPPGYIIIGLVYIYTLSVSALLKIRGVERSVHNDTSAQYPLNR